MELTSCSWRSGVFLGFTLAATIATTHAQLVSTATNDAYANNSALRFNYAEALQKSVYFLEAQQNGPLSPNNRVAWRGNANLSDGSDISRDLAGGLFDAGDHWTTNTTMAFVTTTVAWSAVEKPTGWTSTGQMDELLESLVTVNNYFIKCVLNPNVSNPAQNLDVVIGCGGREAVPPPQVHAIWASAEMASAINLTTDQRFTNRPTFRLNSTAPGGDVPAAMASAMAASSMVIRAHGHLLVGKNGFASFNPTAYADQLYDLAGKLALFANANKGAAMLESMTDAQKATIRAYRSQALRGDGQIVDIQTPTGYRSNPIAQTFTALTWLARATSDPTTRQSWVTLAEQVYEGPYKAENLHDWWRDYGWSNMGKLGAYNMIRLFPTSDKYHYEVQYYAVSFLSYGQTPGGLRLRERDAHEYGSLRHSNNAGVIALYYSDLVDNAPVLSGNTWWKHGASNATLKAEFIRAAKRGTDYALGANPYGRSYLVGFGNQPFNNSHHRGAHGAWNGFDHFNSSNPSYNHNASRHILYGALIAGPDNRDVFLASDNNRTWAQVSGTQDFDTHYLFPNRLSTPVRKSTYIFNPVDQPVQDIIESKFNEVALDYNAGFMANLAWLNSNGYSNGSPIADNQFPPALVRNETLDPWTTDREMLVTATVTEDSSSATQLDGRLWNRSRWPARALTSPSIRYYFTHTGTVTPTLSDATGASISAVQTDGAGQRYVEITWSGVTLNPVNSSNNARSFTLRLAATGWNSSDDWSRQNAALNTLRVLPNTPVYQSGALVGGAQPGTAPTAPSALAVVTNSSTQLTLNWTDNAANETGFKIERSANGTTGWSQIATPSANATTFANTGLTASTTYFYRVRATNAVGDSANTNVANATTQAAGGGSSALLTGTVIGTAGSYSGGSGDDVAKVFDGDLNTFFDASVADGAWAGLDFGSAKTITEVRYAPRSAFPGRMVGAIIQGSSSANFIAGVVNLHTINAAPTTGNLTVQAISNSTGFRYARILMPNGGWGNVAELQFYGVNSGSAPAAPSVLAVVVNSSTQITLTWVDNATDETGFKVERSANGTTGWSQIATPSANATSFTNTGLTASTAYFYRVRATNATGDSAFTSVANATTQAAGGGGLPVITASGENPPNEDRTKAFDGQSSTKWLAFASTAWLQYAYPAPSTAFVTSYALTSANDSPGRDPRNWQLLGSNDGSAWITLDTRSNQTFSARFQRQLYTVASPAAYAYYRLNITSNNGEPNTQLAELELLAGVPAPAAPSALAAATNSSTQITLTWTDNATNETGFRIERSANGTTGWSQIGTPSANATTFANTGLTASTTYFYRVRATNATGDSAYTSVANATTLASGGGLPVITVSQTASGTVSSAFSYQIAASNTPSSYALNSGTLPPGVSLNTTTGLLSGTPTTAGTSTPSFTATNGNGTSAAQSVTITISAGLDPILTGTVSGSAPWANDPAYDANKVFDGNTATSFAPDAATGAFAQIDLGTTLAGRVSTLRFLARSGFSGRMNGGVFQGSNNGTSWTTLHTLSSDPGAAWQQVSVSDSTFYRYLRYQNPSNLADVAEVEFRGVTQAAGIGLTTFRTTNSLAANGSQDLLTPAGDGVQNLLKYAFNMIGTGTGQAGSLTTPNSAVLAASGSAGLPLGGVESGTGKLQITYIRRIASASPAPGITYSVEFSDALATWAVNPSASVSVTNIDTTFERVTVTDHVESPAKRFARVKVTAN